MDDNRDLTSFERGMVVGAIRAGQSVAETADLLGVSRTNISRVYSEWSEKEKTSSQRQSSGRKGTTRRNLKKKMGNSKKIGRTQQHSAIKDGENVASEGKTLSEESQFLQQHSDEGHSLPQTETESNGPIESQGGSEGPLTGGGIKKSRKK